MRMIDQFKDIVKHTHSLGFIEMAKLIGEKDSAKIAAIDADKTVVVYGDLNDPVEGLSSTVGLNGLAQLKGFIDLHEKSDLSIVIENKGGSDVPTELKFDSGDGDRAVYRFMNETTTNDQIKVPPFKGATWDITIVPEKAKVDRLNSYSGILGGNEKRFIVSVNNGVLNFSIGEGPTNRSNLPFAKDVKGTLKHQWSWPLAQVLSILKLNDSEEVTMYFSDMGALKITAVSGLGSYSYILPAVKAV